MAVSGRPLPAGVVSRPGPARACPSARLLARPDVRGQLRHNQSGRRGHGPGAGRQRDSHGGLDLLDPHAQLKSSGHTQVGKWPEQG